MIVVAGMHLPDGDRHFSDQINQYYLFYGRGLYKALKFNRATEICGTRRGHAVDVGAHVGLWSWPLSFDFKKLTAFEPVDVYAECWQMNMAGRDNTELRQYALGESSHTDTFEFLPDGEGTIQWMPGAGEAMFHRLDDQNLEPIDFLKVSCDGCELPVIQGGEQTIRRDKPVVLVQSKRKRSDVYGYPRNGAVDLLKSWGAEIAWSMKGDYCLVWSA